MSRTFRAPQQWRKIRQHRSAMRALGQYAPNLRAQSRAAIPAMSDQAASDLGLVTLDMP